ncbi:MAG: nucleoside monophosphate kinase [Candidatus Zambryskibacteria bacterium]|nr:nucleoside monophosphate kinase [Candidatus Zambryskibacteria bacterium]
MMLHTVIFIGRSGCGKGTQADLLKNRIARHDEKQRHILYVETGERFRNFVRGDSFSSKLSKEIYNKDERQPDFLACFMWASVLVEELLPDMHLVFDGAPRSHSEAVLLSTALQFYKREKSTVIHLKVGHKWAEERLLGRGRADDRTLLKINKRLDWFEADTWPAIEYFKTNSLYRFIEIDGEQPIEKVHSDIVAAYDYNS